MVLMSLCKKKKTEKKYYFDVFLIKKLFLKHLAP
jgi:hypothetical protein